MRRAARVLDKLLTLEPSEVGLVAEAAASLALTRLGIQLLSLETFVRLCVGLATASSRFPDPGHKETADGLHRLSWAVDAASQRVGGRCILRSLGLLWMLSRRGVAAQLCVAVRAQGNPLPGHAWLEVDGEPLGADGRVTRPVLTGSSPAFLLLCRLPGPGESGPARVGGWTLSTVASGAR